MVRADISDEKGSDDAATLPSPEKDADVAPPAKDMKAQESERKNGDDATEKTRAAPPRTPIPRPAPPSGPGDAGWEQRQRHAQATLIALFLIVQVCGVVIAYAVTQTPALAERIEEGRPAFISPDRGQENAVNIVAIGIVGTVVLILLKKYLRFKVRYIVVVAVFGSAAYLASLFFDGTTSFLFGVAVTVLRERWENLTILNASVFVSVLGFGVIFGHWVQPYHAAILLIVLSIYDVIGVLITRHITYLWFGAYKFERVWRDVLAFVVHVDESEVILVGAGDFGFPLLFTFSVTENLIMSNSEAFGIIGGSLVAVGTTVGFAALQVYAMRSEQSKVTGLPGLPFVTAGGLAGWGVTKLLLGV